MRISKFYDEIVLNPFRNFLFTYFPVIGIAFLEFFKLQNTFCKILAIILFVVQIVIGVIQVYHTKIKRLQLQNENTDIKIKLENENNDLKRKLENEKFLSRQLNEISRILNDNITKFIIENFQYVGDERLKHKVRKESDLAKVINLNIDLIRQINTRLEDLIKKRLGLENDITKDVTVSIYHKFDYSVNGEWRMDFVNINKNKKKRKTAEFSDPESATSKFLANSKLSYIYVYDKKIASQLGRYHLSATDTEHGNVGSMYLYKVDFSDENDFITGFLSISTYGFTLCNQDGCCKGDNNNIKNYYCTSDNCKNLMSITNEILGPFLEIIHEELKEHYIVCMPVSDEDKN